MGPPLDYVVVLGMLLASSHLIDPNRTGNRAIETDQYKLIKLFLYRFKINRD